MTEPDRRNPLRAAERHSSHEPTEINGATALATRRQESRTADGKYRLAETLTGTATVSISRERVFVDQQHLAEQFGSLIVITTGNRNDDIRVSQRRDDTLDVNVNGEKFHISFGGRQKLAIRSGGGNDTIDAAGVESDLLVEAGDGDDTVITGAGNDHIDGGRGNDTLLARGGDNDVIGGDGDDSISVSGDGEDVVYAGKGDDVVIRGRGRGVKYIDGGSGNDRLRGGLDKTIFAPGTGQNRALLGTKDDYIFAANGIDPDLGSSIKIAGTPEFRQRVADDLDTLRSSPVGRQMLGELDFAARLKGHSVTITELTNENNGHADPNSYGELYLKGSREGVVAGTGAGATVSYNPSFRGGALPIIVLYHELSHAYNIVTGTLQPGVYFGPGIDGSRHANNCERQAVGLPNGGFKYFGGADGTANPRPLTEDALRAEMGLPLRFSYLFPPTSLSSTNSNAPPASLPLQSTAKYLDSITDAALTNDLEALQKGLTNLVASAESFFREGVTELERRAAGLRPRSSLDVESAQPTRPPQSVRVR